MNNRRPPSVYIEGVIRVAMLIILVSSTNAADKTSTKPGTKRFVLTSSCLDRCRINKTDVNCTRAQCNTIPPNISSETRRLIMADNSIEFLAADSFVNLTKLEHLNLRNCAIRTIRFGTFRYLAELKVLDLSYNRYLRKVNDKIFSTLTNLRVLNLTATRLRRRCKFHSDYLTNLTNLTALYLGLNQLPTLPRFIDHQNKTLLPKIEVLNLNDNNIEHLKQTKLVGLESLEVLILTGNRLHTIKNNTFLNLPRLTTLKLDKNFNFVPEGLSFASLSLKRLSLADVTHKTYLSSDIFEGLPNLEWLNLKNSRRLYKAATPFSSLRNLVKLNLRGVRVRSYSLKSITENLPKLRHLDLSDNELSHLNASLFRNLKLDVLLLRSNWISTITKTTLSDDMWNRLEKVDFSENPFFCDCRLVWFRQWLRNRPKKNGTGATTVVLNRDRMVCIGPAEAKNTKLYLLRQPTREECFTEDSDQYRLAVFLISLAVWLLAPSMSFIHRYRWFLKYYYFNYKIKQRQLKDLQDSKQYNFDAFISYSESDSDWVINQLRPQLETDLNLHLCIHHRDWMVGRDIVDNIVDSIENSRKTVLIVSNAFAVSQWCHFEMTMAQTKLFVDDRDSMILVLLEEIADFNMNPRLQLLMQKKTYVEWTDNQIGQQLFWAKLRQGLTEQSNSVINSTPPKELFASNSQHLK